MASNEEDLPIKIPIQCVSQHFTCPVCMMQMRDVHITPCGHRYCGHCIKECVSRLHKCPVDNKTITMNSIVKDHQTDELISIINSEREKAEKGYFDSLIERATSVTVADAVSESLFSPVEFVLKEHLKQSLIAHERYYQELKHDFNKKKSQIEADYQILVQELHTQGLTQEELSHQLEDVKQTSEQRKQALTEELQVCTQMVANAYDRYLTEYIPNLAVLPVQISLCVLRKHVIIPEVKVQPRESVNDLITVMKSAMSARGDEIIEIKDDVKYVCFGPFSKGTPDEMHAAARRVVLDGEHLSGVTVIPQECRPVLEHAMKPGSVICVFGSVRCKSDLPKVCFSISFEAGKTHKVDYFSCTTCKFNWVCRPCMEVCHKDHEVVPYIMNHQPTWACCYCPKKKKCILQGKPTSASPFHKQWTPH